MLRTRH